MAAHAASDTTKIRNWCAQCGTPYLDADWKPGHACGPTHAVVAQALAHYIAAAVRLATNAIEDANG